ncbi:tRNA (Guanine37-N(1)-) methyltransferase [Fibrobacter sp. UWH9]|uniref:tRNA (guanosine(37)-N1)-methyltransferase TrmD n=1 Tax=unclassified Fibrobacter TaxID=2634177 RepID=UPI0009205190|nr:MULTISPECIES: tRNA (guanosine(37)-N1)-methyltransferase TrmD [Fibrobacter]MDO4947030.1 tRNA (guanosine(37)-N1)-methyltransferase TrmD [Fibrobacter sp.]MCL4101017.1 tRNA (guanine-N(1)-)-methyltransferase [Fibrobacter succinogenes]OWV06940.1 tRNA (guanosine(37)-N1)-methyltransferase TrmD [Fibrobacter sp. UWH3]OWV16177.1 tRNA (guanosine(37)-N1)-methyltransferase TrmD [Fibrobacter sp. UWH1]SHG53020.1 tRNA (Guanine37-N(1)-) methyltransferase [Fibrobacter sp. UWH9]
MKIDCITIFPEMFTPMKTSIMGRAQNKGLMEFNTVYLRDFAINDYGQVDDVPYGGEPGMVIRPEPLANAIRSTGVKEDGGKVIYLTADGVPFNHKMAQELSKEKHLVLICGHYKGIDDRIRQSEVDLEISIGDFVVSGGELPAMLVTDAVVRLIDGALGNRESGDTDSFAQGVLGWPVYTRPEVFEGKRVPDVLLSGHHKNIAAWRRQESLKRTEERRPDIFKNLERDTKFGIK